MSIWKRSAGKLRFPSRATTSLRLLLAYLLAIGGTAGPLAACQIPVFRYALEHWEPDTYRALIVYERRLSEEQLQWFERLRSAAIDQSRPVNLVLETVDLSDARHTPFRDTLPSSVALPVIVLCYPHAETDDETAWVGSLTAEHVDQVVDSPVRREIVARLRRGDSAVWILVECGDAVRDTQAFERLSQALQRARSELKLPELQDLRADESYRPDTKIPLRLEFSIVRLRADDEHESVLRSILRHSEAGLAEIEQPLAIPIYGRGRTYYALAGKGIDDQNILDHSRFLIGGCSCQVKAQHPGIDLPLAATWSDVVATNEPVALVPPSLLALEPLSTAAQPKSPGQERLRTLTGEQTSDLGGAPHQPIKTIGYALAGIAIAVVIATVYLRRQGVPSEHTGSLQ